MVELQLKLLLFDVLFGIAFIPYILYIRLLRTKFYQVEHRIFSTPVPCIDIKIKIRSLNKYTMQVALVFFTNVLFRILLFIVMNYFL